MRISIVVFIFMLLFSLAGAVFYYIKIYQPTREYVKAVIPIYERIGLSIGKPAPEEIRNSADFDGAIQALEERENFIQEIRNDLVLLNPPEKMKVFHQSFLDELELILSALEDSARMIRPIHN